MYRLPVMCSCYSVTCCWWRNLLRFSFVVAFHYRNMAVSLPLAFLTPTSWFPRVKDAIKVHVRLYRSTTGDPKASAMAWMYSFMLPVPVTYVFGSLSYPLSPSLYQRRHGLRIKRHKWLPRTYQTHGNISNAKLTWDVDVTHFTWSCFYHPVRICCRLYSCQKLHTREHTYTVTVSIRELIRYTPASNGPPVLLQSSRVSGAEDNANIAYRIKSLCFLGE